MFKKIFILNKNMIIVLVTIILNVIFLTQASVFEINGHFLSVWKSMAYSLVLVTIGIGMLALGKNIIKSLAEIYHKY